MKIDLPAVTVAELSKKILGVKAGTEGVYAHTLSMEEAGVYGWFMEASSAGDCQKASDAFERAGQSSIG